MHISDCKTPDHTILTKCAKMTEEGHRRHGMNGNSDGTGKDEAPRGAYSQGGGRLKFFKDGKFILELERAREGERMAWVSVPRKTFWPPQGTAASTPSYRQESSTSLSVSDDNSSIQSSPWQRDHSWKQTTPQRNLSKGLTFYYRGKARGPRSVKCRRPYSDAREPDRRACKSDRTGLCNSGRVGKTLAAVVQMLVHRLTSAATPPRGEMVVSPRKRFLREMERDKMQLEENCQNPSQKRSRSKKEPAKVESPVRVNGVVEEPARTTPKNSSYSITSLLAEDKKRSPVSSPSQFCPVSQPQYCSPPPLVEDGWYSESVDRLRSMELSHADKRAMSAYAPYQHYMPPYMYPYPMPPPYYTAPPAAYHRNYMVPSMYAAHSLPVAVRHDAPSCSWGQESVRDADRRDENISDMPLNLSKHAG